MVSARGQAWEGNKKEDISAPEKELEAQALPVNAESYLFSVLGSSIGNQLITS